MANEKQSSEPRSDSIFERDPPNGNAEQYSRESFAITRNLIVLWVVLTTPEWSECFEKSDEKGKKWRAKLAKELNFDPEHLERLHKIATTTYHGDLIVVRELWDRYFKILYSGRPCPGGRILHRIAQLE